MQHYDAVFVKSIQRLVDRPRPRLREIAVAGRSNVGKSSLINALFNQRHLAKVSTSPGKTRLINYFNINDTCYLVDLPGYGFAKRSKAEQKQWQRMLESYLSQNEEIIRILLLIDSRRGVLEIDRVMIDWLIFFKIPFTIILTKTDKLTQSDLLKKKKEIITELADTEVIPFSAKSKTGRTRILELIDNEL